jgi:acyl-coenzyme A synthetase/AMP-(fatty) acid ligase
VHRKGWLALKGTSRRPEIVSSSASLTGCGPARRQTMSNRPNGDYATSDAYVKHASLAGAFKFVGRLDDTLVMVNGEKTNPVPIEGASLILLSDPCYLA